MSSEPHNPPPGASSIDPETGRDRLGPLRPNHGDRRHDLHLLRDLAIVNTRTHAELGPLPPGGLPAEQKRKPQLRRPTASQALTEIEMEDEAMRLKHVAAIAALGAVSTMAGCEPAAQSAEPPNNVNVPAESQRMKEDVVQSKHGVDPLQLDSKYQKWMPYMDFRAKLLEDGWSPVIDPECRKNVVGDNHKDLCAKAPDLLSCQLCDKLPELSACSSDAYCAMIFTKNGKKLSVTAYGDVQDVDAPGQYGFEVAGWEMSGR